MYFNKIILKKIVPVFIHIKGVTIPEMAGKGIIYKRVLLKLTGELFSEKDDKGINFKAYEDIAKKLIIIGRKQKSI